MKKTVFLSLITCSLLCSFTLSAQKKGRTQATPPKQVVLKTSDDTLSYALGVNIAQQGLKAYLSQMGVLADTTAINTDFNNRIENEDDSTKKNKLMSDLKLKIDSANKANQKNISEFLAGFNQTIIQKKDKQAFNTGVAIGSQLASMTENFSKEVLGAEGKFSMNAFAAAFESALKDDELLIENAESIVQDAAMKGQQMKEAQQAEEQKVKYADDIAKGEQFLAENKTKEGVVVLPSGLQYKVIEMGTGEVPTSSSRVKVHYKGTLLDGTVFDSSLDRGEPATFGVTQVIKGWTEALEMMPVGSKWILYIPSDLAYGSREAGAIKPFSTLIFEVELLDIVEQE